MAKTADEMFRELGFVKVPTGDGRFYYEHLTKDIFIDVGSRFSKYDERSRLEFTPEEILACAQLIKEMEVDDGRV